MRHIHDLSEEPPTAITEVAQGTYDAYRSILAWATRMDTVQVQRYSTKRYLDLGRMGGRLLDPPTAETLGSPESWATEGKLSFLGHRATRRGKTANTKSV